jgi:hypothetical protein
MIGAAYSGSNDTIDYSALLNAYRVKIPKSSLKLMSRGISAFFKAALVFLVITGLALTLIGHYTNKAEARADIVSQANRSTRHYLPQGANVNGSAIQKVVHWQDLIAIGNVGIGDGRLRTLVSDVTLDPANFMLPKKYMAANVQMSGTGPSMIVGEPQKDIFHEFPIEAGTIYGKVVGLRTPGGGTMDMGIRTIGYGYYDPKIVGEKIVAVSKILDNIKGNPVSTE